MVNQSGPKNEQLTDKAEKYKQLEKFLLEHEVTDDKDETTNYAFGPPWGKYYIPDTEYDYFLDIYANCLGYNLYLIERPLDIGPLLIDIDFDYNPSIHTQTQKDPTFRIYTIKHIQGIISIVNDILKNHYKWTAQNLTSFVFEKSAPSKKKNAVFKDGFHIVYPYLPVGTKMRYYILHLLMHGIMETKLFASIKYLNTIDHVVDTNVVRTCGWLLYGSQKHEGLPYFLKHIFDDSLNEINIKTYKNRDLVKILSNRKFRNTFELPLNKNIDMDELFQIVDEVVVKYDKNLMKKSTLSSDSNKPKNNKNEFVHDIDGEDDDEDNEDDDDDDDDDDEDSYEKPVRKHTQQTPVKTNQPNLTRKKPIDRKELRREIINNVQQSNQERKERERERKIRIASEIVMILDDRRAVEYNDWARVGWALYSVSPQLLGAFKEFSKKAGSSYDEEGCDKLWKKAKNKGITLGSIKHWAKIDNPIEYRNLLTENINDLMVEAESGLEWPVAKVVFELYGDIYKCTGIKPTQVWYEFQGHRWVEIDGGATLDIRLSEELTKEFAILCSIYSQQIDGLRGTEMDVFREKISNVSKIMCNLQKKAFKDKVIDQCAKIFLDKKFETLLDSNPNLIGFENGVYDLSTFKFRPGTPDDYVTLSVGYDYKTYEKTNKKIKEINTYFRQVQPDADMRKYILLLLASYLHGSTETEQFIIWTGTGCFKKGTLVRMYDGRLVAVENVQLSDKLMGDDGTERLVKDLYRGYDKMYTITQSNGFEYTVNGEHRLALRFAGRTKCTLEEPTQRYITTWYEFDDKKGIVQKSKLTGFQLSDEQLASVGNPKKVIPYDHIITMTVNDYLGLSKKKTKLLKGYVSKGDNVYDHVDITVRYDMYDDFYGFELSGNQRYVLEDGTVTCNSNGKSKTIELFKMAFGDYYGTLPITLLTRNRAEAGKAVPELAQARGKRFLVFQEPEPTDKIHVGYMKELTGGDNTTARQLYKNSFEFKPQFKLLLTCNRLPFIPSTDGGTWRRLRVSPWESKFVINPKQPGEFKRDNALSDKMKKWKKAFLWLLINEYYPKYKSEGLVEPAKVTKFTDKYREQSDTFFDFITKCLEVTKNSEDAEVIDVLFATFRGWYSESMTGKTNLNRKDMVEYFETNGYKVGERFIYGIKFKSNEEPIKGKDLDG